MNTLAKVNPETLPTKKQLETLRTIYRLEKKLGRFPTQRETAAAMGLSENGANGHIKALEERGYLTPPEVIKVQHITPMGMKWVR
jgi:DNA-binding MarR family transcriptional regulator